MFWQRWTRTVCPEGMDFHLRALRRQDLPILQRWLSQPHVERWWHDALDLAGVQAKYGPRIEGRDPTQALVVEVAERPVGWVQWHRWRDYPLHGGQLGATGSDAGLELAIGEPEFLGRGLGSAVIRRTVEDLIFAEPRITACVVDPEATSSASLRAFRKAGFAIGLSIQLRGETCRRTIVRRERQPR